MTDWEAVVGEHVGIVRRTVYRLVGNHADAWDCVQETFLRFWRSRVRYNEQGQARAFLFKIARNLAVDHIRSHQSTRERTASLEEMESSLEARPDFAGTSGQRELTRIVRIKVNELPISQRETFLLFRYHGMSYEEIAEIQGVSVRTVDSRLYRAMKWLGQQLNGHAARISEGGTQ